MWLTVIRRIMIYMLSRRIFKREDIKFVRQDVRQLTLRDHYFVVVRSGTNLLERSGPGMMVQDLA